MSSIFQNAGLVRDNGKVQLQELPTDALPVGAFNFRGMAISDQGRVLYTADTGQARVLYTGIAFSSATGIMLATETPFGATNISAGGLLVDSRGAVVLIRTDPEVIHQGVGLKNTGGLTGSIGELVTVPDVIGQTITAAKSTITTAGLVVGVETQEYNDDFAATLVFKQNPVGGILVESGASVDLWESLGPFPVPTADPNGPYTGRTNLAVQFDGTASTPGAGATIVQYDWDFGDGTGFHQDIGPTPQYTYLSNNTYIVNLRVTNSFAKQDTQTTQAVIDFIPIFQVDALNDNVTKVGNVVSTIVAVDGFTYNKTGTGDVTHNQFQSPNGSPVYGFPGTGAQLSYLNAGAPSSSQPFTIFAVAKVDSTSAFEAICCAGSILSFLGIAGVNGWIARALTSGGSPRLYNTNNYDTGWHVLECVFNGASSVFGVDGLEVTGDPGPNNFQGGHVIGSDNLSQQDLTGQVAEVLVYPYTVFGTERASIRNALIAKWITP